MNRTAEIRLAILRDLAHVPAGLLRREDDIRCRVQLQVVPAPSRAEIETELKELDALRLIRRGIPAGAALDMGITNKAFDSYEQGLIRDVIAARIPAKLDAARLFA